MGKGLWISTTTVALAGAATLAAMPAAADMPAPLPVYAPAEPSTPAARAGQVWVPGRWEWQGNGHEWMPGYYLRSHAGCRPDRNRG